MSEKKVSETTHSSHEKAPTPQEDTSTKDISQSSPEGDTETEKSKSEEMSSSSSNESASQPSETEETHTKTTSRTKTSDFYTRSKAYLCDRNNLTFIIAIKALIISLITLILVIYMHHHDRDGRYGRHHDMRGYMSPYSYSYDPDITQDMYARHMASMREMQDMQAEMQRAFNQRESEAQSLMRIFAGNNQNTIVIPQGVTQSLLSEVNGKVTGSLTFADQSSRDNVAARLQKASVKVQKQGATQLQIESDKGIKYIQTLLR